MRRSLITVLIAGLTIALTRSAVATESTLTIPAISMGPGITRCTISDHGQFVASASASVPAVRFRSTDKYGKWHGDLVVFPSVGGMFAEDPPREYGALNLDAPSTLACSTVTDADFHLTPMSTTIDVGQNVALRSLFLSRDAVTIRLRLFFTDFFSGKTDEPLQDAAYFYRIDMERPVEQIVNGGPTEYLVIRFPHLRPGRHIVTFGPTLDLGDGSGRMQSSVTFTLPRA